jgi:hypothetical protein
VRTGGVPGSTDIKTYDGGKIYVSTSGNQSTATIGELHVRYEVEFEVPVLDSTTGAMPNNSVAYYQSASAEAAGATGVTANLALATEVTNGISAVNTSGSVVLPVGNYLLDLNLFIANSATANVNWEIDVLSGGTSILATSILLGGTMVGNTNNNTESRGATFWYASDGTSALTFPVTAAYSSGTVTMAGALRIMSI